MIKKTLSSKKGASSILVILLLVVLLVFGIAALTTALSSYRLGQKVVDWNGSYYTVEAQAQQRFAAIEKAVTLAYEETNDDIENVLENKISSLDFDIAVNVSNNEMQISFETWNETRELGLEVTLIHDLAHSKSLKITGWKEI